MAAITGYLASGTVAFQGTTSTITNMVTGADSANYALADVVGEDIAVKVSTILTTGDGTLTVTVYYYEVDVPSV